MSTDAVEAIAEWDTFAGYPYTDIQLTIIGCRLLLKYGRLEDFLYMYERLEKDNLLPLENIIAQQIWILYLFEKGQPSQAIERFDRSRLHYPNIDGLSVDQVTPGKLFSSTTGSVLYQFSRARYLEHKSKYEEAIKTYQGILKIYEKKQDFNLLELSQIYYHLGRLMKYTGELRECINYFNQAIKCTVEDTSSSMATILNHLGELLLITGDYISSKSYLDRVLKMWNALDDPIGRSWALYNLGILSILQGKIQEGISSLHQLYSLSHSQLDIVYQAEQLFYLVIFTLEGQNLNKSQQYLKKLKSLTETGNKLVITRYNIAHQYFNLILDVVPPDSPTTYEVSQLMEDPVPITETLILTLMYLQLLVLELDEIEKEADRKELNLHIGQIQDRLLRAINNPVSLSYFVSSQKLLSYLDRLQNQSQDLEGYIRELDQINSNIHSIPRLKVLVSLHMRISLSFSELVELSSLSRGSVFNICKQLANDELITIHKEVQDSRFVTIYTLTQQGLTELREYSNSFQSILDELNGL